MNLPTAHNSEVIAHTSLNAIPTLFRLAFTPEAEIDTLSQMYAPDHKHTAIVTIGRCIGDEPMPSYRWTAFSAKVGRIVSTRGLQVYTWAAQGRGTFTSASGKIIREESMTYVYELEEAAVKATVSLLHDLALEYGQESIALVLGATIFC